VLARTTAMEREGIKPTPSKSRFVTTLGMFLAPGEWPRPRQGERARARTGDLTWDLYKAACEWDRLD
jgi:hypothetical protein